MDMKTAYLQGQNINRDLTFQPRTERNQPNCLQKLNKAVYGLSKLHDNGT